MNTKFSIKKDEKKLSAGQSLVEFAMAATLMIFLLLATIDFGLAFFSWIALRDAAQEGATFGSLEPPCDLATTGCSSVRDGEITAIKDRVKQAATAPVNMANLDTDKIVVEILDEFGNLGGTPCPGHGVRVTVTYQYNVITPMVSNFIGRSYIPISATVADTILQAPEPSSCPK